MIKFTAQVKNVTNSGDGGYILKLDLTESESEQAGILLKSKGKNIVVAMEFEE
jgi:hypothetical protein